MKSGFRILIATAAMMCALPISAHHSYAMFDFSKRLTVTGTVAKLEWTNPHSYLWIYVPNQNSASGYDLYSFENGPISLMTRLGWTKTTFAAGDQIAVEYAPLKDGRTGGHYLKATRADGRVVPGDDGLPVDQAPAQR